MPGAAGRGTCEGRANAAAGQAHPLAGRLRKPRFRQRIARHLPSNEARRSAEAERCTAVVGAFASAVSFAPY